jgi:hypothetical protein
MQLIASDGIRGAFSLNRPPWGIAGFAFSGQAVSRSNPIPKPTPIPERINL